MAPCGPRPPFHGSWVHSRLYSELLDPSGRRVIPGLNGTLTESRLGSFLLLWVWGLCSVTCYVSKPTVFAINCDSGRAGCVTWTRLKEKEHNEVKLDTRVADKEKGI